MQMKNKLLVISFLIVLMFTGCGKKADTEPVVSEAVEEIEEVEPVEETEPVETIAVVEGTALTQEELDKLNAEATTDDQKKALDAYETITKEGSWTSPNGVTYTEVVGKPDGSWRRMTDAEAQAIIAQGEDAEGYVKAKAELQGKDYVKYDTVDGIVYYDPYAYAEAMQPRIQESIRISEVDEDLSADEVPYKD